VQGISGLTRGGAGLRDAACPFCGGFDLSKSTVMASDTDPPQPLGIVECRRCAVAWQQRPWRTFATTVKYFSDRYASQEAGTYFDPARRAAVAALEMDWVETIATVRGTLLDVGAGDGCIVREAAKRGWIATGIEPAAVGGDTFSEGGRVIRGTLHDLPPGAVFDVVTLFDVIEHVDDGLDLLSGARSHVADSGFVVVETGNYGSAARIQAGPAWWCYQAEHRWYYTPERLLDILRLAGFHQFHFCPRVLRPGWSGCPRYAGPSHVRQLARFLKRPWRALPESKRYLALRAAMRREYSGIEIMTIAARP